MKLMVASSRYPAPGEPYNHMFVHTRSRAYLRHGANVEVFVPATKSAEYEMDGVSVKTMPVGGIAHSMGRFDGIMLHLLHPHLRAELDGIRIVRAAIATRLPILIFLHGIEVQSFFHDRRYDIRPTSPTTLLRAVFHDFYRLPRSIHAFKAALAWQNCRFVTPSMWFLKLAAKTLGDQLLTRGQVIQNGIDTELFPFREKPHMRKRLLTIRPLHKSGKYALDLALKVMTNLPADYTLDIFGHGPDETAIRKMIEHMGLAQRVTMYNAFIEHAQLPELYSRYGAYLAVTRWDTQGVSMCEAMASGLPVISFRVAAIPEFVEHGETGLLAQPFDVIEMAHLVRKLESANYANRIARNAHAFVERIGISGTTRRELSLVECISSVYLADRPC